MFAALSSEASYSSAVLTLWLYVDDVRPHRRIKSYTSRQLAFYLRMVTVTTAGSGL